MTLIAQPPPSHPAMQMRKYYADVYTGSSIVEFSSYDLDSILMVASQLVIKAQVISIYSYLDNPYKNRNVYGIYQTTLEKAAMCTFGNRYKYYPYISISRGIKPFYNYWSPRQHRFDFPRGISGCYRYRRPRANQS